jgi:hypothetical protein
MPRRRPGCVGSDRTSCPVGDARLVAQAFVSSDTAYEVKAIAGDLRFPRLAGSSRFIAESQDAIKAGAARSPRRSLSR